MQLYDRNEDGLLDLKDMAQLLNLTDNFLLQFNIEVMYRFCIISITQILNVSSFADFMQCIS